MAAAGETLFLGIDASAAQRGADDFARAVDRVKDSGAAAAKPTSILGREIEEMRRKAESSSGALAHLAKSTDHAGASAKSAVSGFGGLTSAFPMLGAAATAAGAAIAAAFSVSAIIGYASTVTEHFADIDDAATRVGTSAERLQVLRNVFIENASSASELSTAMEFLQAKVGDALTGTDAAVTAFQRLGISTKDLAATQGDAALQMQLVATGIASIGDPSERASALLDVLGRSGKSTQEALLALGNTLDSRVSVAISNSTILTNDAVKEYGRLSDQLKLLDAEAKVLAGQGLGGLAVAWAKVKIETLGAIVAMKKYMSEQNQALSRKLDFIDPGAVKPEPAPAQPPSKPAHELVKGYVTDRNRRQAELQAGMGAADKIGEWAVYEANQKRIEKAKADAERKASAGAGGAGRGRGGGGGGGRASSAVRDAESDALESTRLIESVTAAYLQASDQRIALAEMERDKTLAAIEATSLSAIQKEDLRTKATQTAAEKIGEIRERDAEEEQRKQQALLNALGKYEGENLAVHGRATEAIILQREEEIRAIDAIPGASDEQKAQARVFAEDTASQKIIEIRRREAAEISSLQEENLQVRASNAFGDDRKQLQKRLLEMQRDSQLADIQASKMSEDMKSQASAIKSDTFAQKIAVVDPTPWESASRNLQEFGEGLTSVEGMTQGVIQGISSIGNTAASAFADAIMSGESFSDTLEKLGQSLTKMLLQMTMQMAMQQALGAGASGLGALMGPGAGGAAYSPAEGGGVFGGTAATMAKGGVADTGLVGAVYSQPTYFNTAAPEKRTTKLLAASSTPNFSYDTAFAKGEQFGEAKRGIMGEAGPEAVMPLTQTATGQLGISSRNDEGVSNILPLKRMPTGQLGVTQPETQPLEPPGYDKALAEGGIVADKSGVANSIITRPTYFMVHEPRTYTISAENPTVNFTSPPTTGRTPSLSYDTAFAKGSVVKSETVNRIIERPTYIPMPEPGLTPMARGRGLMGEAGPEAVLPLTRTPTGELGVSGGGGGGNVSITINNNSKANVTQESKEDASGNKDIILTIADQVETIVASRLSRSGTRVNRAAGSVGSVVAR